jgi:hypothetical protein
MQYEAPKITDYGSIVENTFTNAGGGSNNPDRCQGNANPPKDKTPCSLDCFSEWSCPGAFIGSP